MQIATRREVLQVARAGDPSRRGLRGPCWEGSSLVWRTMFKARQFFSGTPVMYFFSLRVANALITFSLNSAAGAPVKPVRWTVYNAQLLTGALLSGLPRFTLFFSFVLFCCSGAHRAPRAPPGGRVAVYSAPRGLVTRYSHLGSQGPKSPSYLEN